MTPKEYYKNNGQLYKENRLRRSMGLPPIKSKPINECAFIVEAKALDIDIAERLEEQDKIASRLQRKITGWWEKNTDKQSIIIVTPKNICMKTKTIRYIVELYQLNLQAEDIEKFKDGAEKIVKDQLEGENL